MNKKIIYIDMDFTLCDFGSAYNEVRKKHPDIKYPHSQPGFFENLKPIDQAIEVYLWLNNQENLDVYILTAPSVRNPLCYTEKRLWVEHNLGLEMAYKLIISPNKGLNKGHYLIDDYTSGKGQEHFEGEVLQFGSEQFPNWQSIKDYFNVVLESRI